MSIRAIFAKLLPSRFAADFLDGHLYLNTYAYYGSVDSSDTVRYDPYDGVDHARQAKEVAILSDEGVWLPFEGLINPVTSRNAGSAALNVLCMYTMTDQAGVAFDTRNLAFGDTAVVIANQTEFFRRIKLASEASGKRIAHGPVQYVSRTDHDGPMGPFRKFDEHSYQNEFRFVFDGGDRNPCRLPIGDIRDIAFETPAADIPRFWQYMLQF